MFLFVYHSVKLCRFSMHINGSRGSRPGVQDCSCLANCIACTAIAESMDVMEVVAVSVVVVVVVLSSLPVPSKEPACDDGADGVVAARKSAAKKAPPPIMPGMPTVSPRKK